MLLARTHNEGKHYIVQVPNSEFSGKRLNMVFVEGTGRTADVEKAKFFDDYYGYDVIAYQGAPRWGSAFTKEPEHLAKWKAEPSIVFVNDAEEPDEDDGTDAVEPSPVDPRPKAKTTTN